MQALFKHVAPDASGKETDVACRDSFTNCRTSRTADLVLEYAKNNTMWHRDFGEAFQILIQHGYPSNHLVEAGIKLPQRIDPVVTEVPSRPPTRPSSPPPRPSSPPPRPSSPPPRPSSPPPRPGSSSPRPILETDSSNEQVDIDVTIALVTVIIVIFGVFLLVLTLFL